jgi:hypothetical protein
LIRLLQQLLANVGAVQQVGLEHPKRLPKGEQVREKR